MKRYTYTEEDSRPSDREEPLLSAGTILKLLVGTGFGIYCIIAGARDLGIIGCLLAIPVCIALVFLICLIIKAFGGS